MQSIVQISESIKGGSAPVERPPEFQTFAVWPIVEAPGGLFGAGLVSPFVTEEPAVRWDSYVSLLLNPKHGNAVALPAVYGNVLMPIGADANVSVTPVTVESHSAVSRLTRERLHGIFRLLTPEPERVSATEARQRFAELAAWCTETHRPVLITSHGKPELVMLSFSTFKNVLKGIAREVVGAVSRRSPISRRAQEIIEAEAESINERLRQRDFR